MSACDGCLHRAYLVAELAPRIAALLDRPRNRARAVLALGDDDLIAAVGGTRANEVRERMRGFRAATARAEAEAAEVAAVCRHDDLYPAPLRELGDAPAVLFAVGSMHALRELGREPGAALVGTRRASPYGLEMARSLGRGLGAAGVPVVSGLALGIDGAAHRGCL